MLRIKVCSIRHGDHRYETVGDYYKSHGVHKVFVSEMSDEYKEFLVAFHEQIEMILCQLRGIKEEDITAFDIKYEAERKEEDETSEPGDSPEAPYNKEHVFATKLERMLCEEMGIDWEDYEKTIYAL